MAAFNIARIYRQRPLPAGMAEFGGAINVLGIKCVFSVGSVPSVVKSLVLNHVNRFARVATYMRHYGFNG